MKKSKSLSESDKSQADRRDPKQPKPLPSPDTVIEVYLADIDCIRELFLTVTPLLRQQDAERQKGLHDFAENLKRLHKAQKLKALLTNTQMLIDSMLKLSRGDRLFRGNSIIMLVSQFDAFFSELTAAILRAQPDRLKKAERTVSFEEISRLGTIESLKDSFVNREVDAIMRESHTEQFKYLEKLLGIPLREDVSLWGRFIELTERRNLHVHCAGKISSQYLAVCRENGVSPLPSAAEGEFLAIDDVYFEQAYATSFEMGFRLGQTVLRKISSASESLKGADVSVNMIGFKLLQSENWKLGAIVFDYLVKLQPKWVSDDEWRKMFLINSCIALKFDGRTQECESLLGSVDWTSADPKFRLAVSVLKCDFGNAEKLMLTLSPRGHVTEAAFREWPLFREFRASKEFLRGFKKLFHKDFISSSVQSVESQIAARGQLLQ